MKNFYKIGTFYAYGLCRQEQKVLEAFGMDWYAGIINTLFYFFTAVARSKVGGGSDQAVPAKKTLYCLGRCLEALSFH